MEFQNIRFTREDRVATITLNRPEALNAFTPELLAELDRATEAVAGDAGLSVLILTGAGRAFCAGMDVKATLARNPDLSGGNVGDAINAPGRRVLDRLESMPQAVIAKVNGVCFTGGVELILACDITVAAEEAVFADTHAIVGVHPSLGLSQRLPRRVGMIRAKELSFTGRRFDGREAAAIGLALEAVPLAELDARVEVLASAIAANSPGAIAAYKDLYRIAENTSLADGLDYETTSEYDIPDAATRFAAFVAKLSEKG